MIRLVILSSVLAIVSSQPNQLAKLECGFTCTRRAQFYTVIDGTYSVAPCTTSEVDPYTRCTGCCQSRALAAGLTTLEAAGFLSTNAYECICCFYNKC